MSETSISVLIIDDEAYAEILADRFSAMGHEIAVAKNGREGLNKILENQPDVVFLDLQMPQMDGMQVLEELSKRGITSTVVVLTAHGTIPLAVQAMRCGAYDFLAKPLQMKEAERVLRHAIERHSLQTVKASLAEDLSRQYGEIITQDPRFFALIEEARKAARTDLTVLLLGESGTGKELFARHIHASSLRREQTFMAINCAAIPETLFESELFGHEKGAFTGADRQRKGKVEIAQGGTLFLDEIGDLPEATQAKLLRVLQEREFQRVGGEKTLRADVRIIASTNRDLKQAVDRRRFRDDLYYRLNVLAFRLPPLRERPGDVPLLAEHFLRRVCQDIKRNTLQLTKDAMNQLKAYSWPGNVRELRNLVERLAVLAPDDVVGPELLPEEILTFTETAAFSGNAKADSAVLEQGYHYAVWQYQRRVIAETLEECEGNQGKAAELLKLNRTYLSRLMKQFRLR